MKFVNDFWWPDNVNNKGIEMMTHSQISGLKQLLQIWPNNKKNTIIQAGGSYGMWSKLLFKYFKWVYTFEPEPRSYNALLLNCPETHIMKFQKALSDKIEEVVIARKGSACHYIVRDDDADVRTDKYAQLKAKYPNHISKVESITIDSLDLKNCDGVLLDVEKWEYHALKGGIKTIKQFKPLILVEDGYKIGGDVNELLNELDYKLVKQISHDVLYAYKGKMK